MKSGSLLLRPIYTWMGESRPPHPRPRFVSGNYFDFYQDQLGFLTDCAERFGGIVYLRFFHIPVYLINDPDLIEDVFAKAQLRKPKTVSTPLQKKLFGNGLLASEGEFWLKQRRLLQHVFERKRLDQYADTVVKVTEDFFRDWHDGDSRIIDHEFTELTLKIAAKTFFGIDHLNESDAIRELVEALKIIFEGQSRLSWFSDNFLPTANNRRFKRAVKAVDDLIGDIIAARRKNHSDQNDLLSILLSAENGMTEKQIRDEIVTFFVAGHQTTAITLTWLWIMLARNAEASNKLRSEVGKFHGRALSLQALSELPFTAQLIKETLRMFPPNRSVAREVVEPYHLQSFNLPKGSQIVMSQWVLHRDPKYFECPDEFRPDRWTSEFEKQLPKYAYFPFGLGNRTCIGRSFAMMETSLILAIIARQFSFTLDSDSDPEPIPVILLRPRHKSSITVKSM
jgi:cytochrome P450